MRVPFSWLKEYIDEDIELESISNSLTMAGLEVGAIEKIDGEHVLEFEITPNRADCLSIIGIAREIKAIFGFKLKKPEFKIKKELKNDGFKISILNPELCYRYTGRILKGVKISSSPKWLKKRLEISGIRSINNVVDLTNYVLLEYGHPLHVFDLDLLEGYQIRVGIPRTVSGKDEEEIVTLDGVRRIVKPDELLIWDGKKAIAVAGVMGGANTEVTEKTVNILIESAYFNPESIRKTSKRLALKTESSHRFEKGTDIEALREALDRAVFLIQELAGGMVYEVIDVYPIKIPQKKILFSTEKICKFIGMYLEDEEILKILELLEIDIEKKDTQYIAKAPSHRQDLAIEEDISEEIVRIYGYDKVPSKLIDFLKPVSENYELSKKREFLNIIRDYMIALGYTEAINFSFMSADDIDLFRVPQNDIRRQYISLLNPLRQEDSIMRTMILPNLLKNIEKNTARGIETLKLFEIGKVFLANEKDLLPQEPVHLGIVSKKEDYKSLFKDDPYDFYALKGLIDGIGRHFKLENLRYVMSSEPFLHQGQSADILVGNKKLGFLGVISPEILSKFGFKTKSYICVAEIDLDSLLKIAHKKIKYKPFSIYPAIKRDTALLVSEDFEAQKILDLINAFGNELVEEVYIFDLYRGKGIPEGKQNIAFRITYRAFDRTLTSEEIDQIHNQLVEKIVSETGAQLRIQ